LDIFKLKARPRTGTGKKHTRKLRQQGWIPAVYYGHDRPSVNIEVDCKEFGALLRARKGHLIDLCLSEKEGDSVAIIKEVQRDVLLPAHIVHIDFQHASMDEPVTVEVQVEILGTPIGVLEEEGVLNHPAQHLTVHCLPGDIPEKISIDVSALHIGDSIHVSDISIPNVEIRHSAEEVVASVTRASKIEEALPPAAEGVEGEAVEGEAAAGEGPAEGAEGASEEGSEKKEPKGGKDKEARGGKEKESR
jgi:large subunit ribosomal protein L25